MQTQGITSVTDTINTNQTPAETTSVSRTCLSNLLAEDGSTSVNVDLPASVRNAGSLAAVLNDLSSATDGGQHNSTMLQTLRTSGSNNQNASSMIHHDGDTLYIGVRRSKQTQATPGNATDVPTATADINSLVAITDQIAEKAINDIRLAVIDSEL